MNSSLLRYVAPTWSAMAGWGYAITECELVNGQHTNHRSVATGTGYPSRTAAVTAGQDAIAGNLVEAELLAADRDRNVDKGERLARANDAEALVLQMRMERAFGVGSLL